MKIKELHKDIERYLKEDCYCPNEIYGTDGFGYRLHYGDDECFKFVDGDDFITCITEYAFNEKQDKPMILVFFVKDEKIIDAVEYDATENNIKGFKNYIKNGEKFTEDYFNKDYNNNLKEFLTISDMIMIE